MYNITYHEDASGNTVLKYSGDAQAIVDAAAAEARGHREHGRFSGRSEFRKVLELDPIAMMEVARQHNLSPYDSKVVEIMMGRDYSKFRCVDDPLLWKGKRNVKIITSTG